MEKSSAYDGYGTKNYYKMSEDSANSDAMPHVWSVWLSVCYRFPILPSWHETSTRWYARPFWRRQHGSVFIFLKNSSAVALHACMFLRPSSSAGTSRSKEKIMRIYAGAVTHFPQTHTADDVSVDTGVIIRWYTYSPDTLPTRYVEAAITKMLMCGES